MLFVELSSRKELLREDFRRFNKDFPRFDQLLPENNSLPPHQGLLLIPEKWPKKHFQWTPLSGIFPNTCCSGQTKSPFSSRSCQHSLVGFHFFCLKFVNEHCLLVRARSRSCLDCNSTEAREPHLLWHRVCSSHFDFDTLIFSKVAKDKCDRWGYQQQHPDLFSGEHQQGDGVECKQRRWHEQGDRHQQQPDHQQ